MTPVEWSAILALVGGAVDIALRIAEAIRGCGGAVAGCPAEVEAVLQPADIPTGEAGLDARSRAIARSRGLDRRGLADRGGPAQDYDELLRPAVVQRLRAAVRGPTEQVVLDAVLLRATGLG